MPQLPDPPSAFTGAQLAYLREVARVVRSLPQWSYFTASDPNGVLIGTTGDRAVYVGSVSTLNREWVKTSDPGVVSTASWAQLGLVP